MAWHLKGSPTLAQWLEMTAFDRAVVADYLREAIEETNRTGHHDED